MPSSLRNFLVLFIFLILSGLLVFNQPGKWITRFLPEPRYEDYLTGASPIGLEYPHGAKLSAVAENARHPIDLRPNTHYLIQLRADQLNGETGRPPGVIVVSWMYKDGSRSRELLFEPSSFQERFWQAVIKVGNHANQATLQIGYRHGKELESARIYQLRVTPMSRNFYTMRHISRWTYSLAPPILALLWLVSLGGTLILWAPFLRKFLQSFRAGTFSGKFPWSQHRIDAMVRWLQPVEWQMVRHKIHGWAGSMRQVQGDVGRFLRTPRWKRIKIGARIQPRNPSEWQLKVVLILASAVAIYVPLVQPLYFGGSDHLDNIRIAYAMLGKAGGIYIPWRPPGMAIFLILTGVVWLDTWHLYEACCTLMSAAIPLLIYGALRRFGRNWAMVAGLLAIVSAVPYAYARQLFAEHLFHFLHFLSIFLIAAYFSEPSRKGMPYWIALSLFALLLVRPTVGLYYWIFLGIALATARPYWRPLLRATLIYCLLVAGWAIWDRSYGSGGFSLLFPPQSPPQRRFVETYFAEASKHLGDAKGLKPAIDPEDGAASALLYESLREYLHRYPERWKNTRAEDMPFVLFGRYAGDEEQLIRAIMTKPNVVYFGFIRTVLNEKFGAKSEQVMDQIAREHGRTGVIGLARYLFENPKKLLIGGTPSTSGRYLLGSFYLSPDRDDNGCDFSVPSVKLLEPGNGPATREFLASVYSYLEAFPSHWEHSNKDTEPFTGNPKGLFDSIFGTCTGTFEGFYWDCVTKYYGVEVADYLFVRVAKEAMWTYPKSLLFFWDNFLAITLVRPWGTVGGSQTLWEIVKTWGDLNYPSLTNQKEGLLPGLAAELEDQITVSPWARPITILYGTTHQFAPVFVISGFLLLPFALLSRARPLALAIAGFYLYHTAALSVFALFSCYRYEDVGVLLPILLTCLGSPPAIQAFRQGFVICKESKTFGFENGNGKCRIPAR